MSSLLDATWTLPGPSSPYLVVRWYDEAAKDTRRVVSAFSAIRMLDEWMDSRRRVLQEIYEALEGAPPAIPSSAGRTRNDEQLKKRLAEALRTGVLVVLQEEPASESSAATPSAQKPPTGLPPPKAPAPAPAVAGAPLEDVPVEQSTGKVLKV